MQKPDLTLQHLYPIAGNNAIEAAAFAVEWVGERDPDLLAGFLGQQATFQRLGYQQQEPITAFNFSHTPLGFEQSTSNAGYTFRKLGHSGVLLREVTLRDNQCVITVRDYSRWDDVWVDVEKLLGILIKLLAERGKVLRSVALQYIDKFQWKDLNAPLPTAQVLKPCDYLPANARQVVGQWHSTHGFFAKTEIHDAPSRLDNINISVALESNVSTLALLLVHQFTGLTLSPKAGDVAPAEKQLKDLFYAAHATNKQYLQELLADEVCDRIGLKVL